MKWPKEMFDAFAQGLTVEPVEGVTPHEVYQAVFDETARRAVWRAQGEPARLGDVLRSPFTPLGSVVPCDLGDRVLRVTLHGTQWGKAVNVFYEFMEQNAAQICEAFQDEMEPYDDMSGAFQP